LRDPSPESEVEKYLASKGLADVVEVRDCGYSDPGPGGSTFDLYWCDLEARRPVVLERDKRVAAGSSTYCFFVPRADRFYDDFDDDASPYGRHEGHDCFGP